jgi:hypothetical protein
MGMGSSADTADARVDDATLRRQELQGWISNLIKFWPNFIKL